MKGILAPIMLGFKCWDNVSPGRIYELVEDLRNSDGDIELVKFIGDNGKECHSFHISHFIIDEALVQKVCQ